MNYYVYILTNKKGGVLYTGVTNDLLRRTETHKAHADKKSFTSKYNADKLVYFETFNDITNAISREKQIKSGSRAKKVALIEKDNPLWRDLSDRKSVV